MATWAYLDSFTALLANHNIAFPTRRGGGWGGFAVSVSAGKESQKSSGYKSTNNTYEKTMIAKYMVGGALAAIRSFDCY